MKIDKIIDGSHSTKCMGAKVWLEPDIRHLLKKACSQVLDEIHNLSIVVEPPGSLYDVGFQDGVEHLKKSILQIKEEL